MDKEELVKLVEYGMMAPSGHNSQPWKFRINKNSIEIHPDYKRVRQVVDPHNRELYISLGAVAKNIEIAANDLGILTSTQILPDKILVEILGKDKLPQKSNLAEYLSKRRTNRGDFWTKKIEREKLEKLSEIGGEKVRFIDEEKLKNTISELVEKADLVWFKNQELMDELEGWLRDDLEMAKDGLSTGVLNLYKAGAEIKYLFSGDSEKARVEAYKDKQRTKSAPLLAVIMSKNDKVEDWVEAGRVFEELALVATKLGIANSFLNRPLELSGYRKKLAGILKTDQKVQLLLRLGYAKKRAKKSFRREVEEVLM